MPFNSTPHHSAFKSFLCALVSPSSSATTCTRDISLCTRTPPSVRVSCTLFGTGTCSSNIQLLLVVSLSIVTISPLRRFPSILASSSLLLHDHFQIASFPSFPRCLLTDRSCEPNYVRVPRDDFSRGCFDAQVHAILQHARQFPTRFLLRMTSLALLLFFFAVARALSSRPRPTSNFVYNNAACSAVDGHTDGKVTSILTFHVSSITLQVVLILPYTV